jgi:bifunctional DNA primase/polymerase-like protein/AAA domain-containing protein
MSQHPHAESGASPPKLSLLGRSALAYAERFGWAVHPLKPGAKTPLSAHGFKDASKDPEQIRACWTQHPEANIGVATGAISGISVLDEDVKNGAGGEVTLTALLAEHGESLESHVRQTTWSGGRQYFFAYDPRARQGAGSYGEGLDGRNDGGYVVAPPSVVNGKRYAWAVKPAEGGACLPMPAWLLELGAKVAPTSGERRNPPGWADELMMKGALKGDRDHQANRLIKHCRETGKSETDCWAWLTTFGSNCTPPFDPKTDRKIADKIEKAYAKPRAFDGPAPVPIIGSSKASPVSMASGGHEQLVLTDAKDVTIARIDWLWPDRIALGMMHLLIGDQDMGKGLTLASITALVTTGRPWPDDPEGTKPREPRHVLILSAEDPKDTVLVPRLIAAGADLSLVTFLDAVKNEKGQERSVAVNLHMPLIEATVVERKTALTIIDPLNACLGTIDTYTDNVVRDALNPLLRTADHQHMAVIALMHLGKNNDRAAIYRALGSVAFSSIVRASYCLARDPTDEPGSPRRLFLQVKKNIAAPSPGLVLTIEETTVPHSDDGFPISTAMVRWTKETTKMTADEALGKPKKVEKLAQAVEFLKDLLAAGPVNEREIEGKALVLGISSRTLRRAKKTLGVESRKASLSGGWDWFLGTGYVPEEAYTAVEAAGPVVAVAQEPAADVAVVAGALSLRGEAYWRSKEAK